ncbi:YozQ family protein [Paenibacillus sp.]|uniref:YozQ family protein n=1 Tax=Paenibacillus sp. TaxID=58172 RepID=UPI002D3C14BE|nr:YozQ family protein [Paenibacillus sp.]HZG86553.1 YozQ family protein [Paenibacillus sp.]
MERENGGSTANDELADRALLNSYGEVAEAKYEGSEPAADSQLQQGLTETYEQIQDDYFAGGNERTFLRDGEDLGKTDGYEPR